MAKKRKSRETSLFGSGVADPVATLGDPISRRVATKRRLVSGLEFGWLTVETLFTQNTHGENSSLPLGLYLVFQGWASFRVCSSVYGLVQNAPRVSHPPNEPGSPPLNGGDPPKNRVAEGRHYEARGSPRVSHPLLPPLSSKKRL